MIVRADQVAGGLFVVLGTAAFVIGGELPFGSLAGPGAGMMPKVVAGLMIAFALVILAGARAGPALTDVDWSDGSHAAGLVLATAAAVALYQPLGFLITMSLLVFSLLVVVERRHPFPAAAYSIALTLFAYWLFGKALKTPLERGLLWL
jgi:hypothetical protein